MSSLAMFVATTSSAVADGSSCPDQQLSQPFLPWGDSSQYELLPNGDFEQGLDGWTVSGGDLVAQPEPWMVTDDNETQSLELPAGSTATSPATCIDVDDPTIKFFAVNNGDPLSALVVGVSFTTASGNQISVPVGLVGSNGSWAPTQSVWILVNLLTFDGSLPVQFTFTPIGNGDWYIDDIYVDPWGRS